MDSTPTQPESGNVPTPPVPETPPTQQVFPYASSVFEPGARWWPNPWVAPRPRPDPSTVYKPGIWFYLISVVVVLIGIYDSSLPGGTGISVAVWLAGWIMAMVWFVAFVIGANESRLSIGSRTWARWVGIPAIGVLFVAMVSTNVPTSTRFQLSRPSLDAAASDARAGHSPSSGWIGLMPVDEIDVYPDGVVTFTVSGGNQCGFANFTGAWPNGNWEGTEGGPITKLATNWWTWCQNNIPD
jgi:hypothetical protein